MAEISLRICSNKGTKTKRLAGWFAGGGRVLLVIHTGPSENMGPLPPPTLRRTPGGGKGGGRVEEEGGIELGGGSGGAGWIGLEEESRQEEKG